eukprot:TRINITY_DN33620_c0_g1_i1.p1 TRINITY_DN33620_c0_g1~~TRINITY_DN33620_c0_g1_i1.p1  ORF type:complete len:654 (+),score=187.36 TRINITY_DN33620_c0_g1_i1:75-2036(+)
MAYPAGGSQKQLPAVPQKRRMSSVGMGVRRRSVTSMGRRDSNEQMMASTAPENVAVSPFANVRPATVAPWVPPALPYVWGGDREHPMFRPPDFETFSTLTRLKAMRHWHKENLGCASRVIPDTMDASNWAPPGTPFLVKLGGKHKAQREAAQKAAEAEEAAARKEAEKAEKEKGGKKKPAAKKSAKKGKAEGKESPKAEGKESPKPRVESLSLPEAATIDSSPAASGSASPSQALVSLQEAPSTDATTSLAAAESAAASQVASFQEGGVTLQEDPSGDAGDDAASEEGDMPKAISAEASADPLQASEVVGFQEGGRLESVSADVVSQVPADAEEAASLLEQVTADAEDASRLAEGEVSEMPEATSRDVTSVAFAEDADAHSFETEYLEGGERTLENNRVGEKSAGIRKSDATTEAERANRVARYQAASARRLEEAKADNPALRLPCIASRMEDIDPWKRELDLRHCCLGEYGAGCMAAIINEVRALEQIELTGNYIGSKGMKDVTAVLETQKDLKVIGLSWNGLGDEGCGFLTSLIRSHPMLEEVTLTHNRIGDSGAELIAGAIKEHPVLRRVDLQYNAIFDKGAECLLFACNKRLSVSVANNPISEDKLKELTAAAEKAIKEAAEREAAERAQNEKKNDRRKSTAAKRRSGT